MIKIGHFSKISQVSVKTLRYYDEVGLLKPVQVDRFTNYRYYELDQLPTLYRILALKDLGLSLDQISGLLDQGLPAEELRGMLRLKQVELRELIATEQERLRRIDGWLNQLDQETHMPTYTVVLKKTEPVLVAGLRETIPTFAAQGPSWEKLEGALAGQSVTPNGPCLALYHSDEEPVDAEMCEPVASLQGAVSARLAEQGVKLHELPVEEVASLVHHGPIGQIGQAYQALFKWINDNGYRICGPTREIYLVPPVGGQDDPANVTELQFPVTK